MGLARFIANAPAELARIDVELVELLSRMGGALGWGVTPEGEIRVAYDGARISERTLVDALRGLGFQPAPVPVRTQYRYPVRRTGKSRA